MSKRAVTVGLIVAAGSGVFAQDRLKTMPGYDRYQQVLRDGPRAVRSGLLATTWVEGGKAVEFTRDGERYRFDVGTRQTTEQSNGPAGAARIGRPAEENGETPDRARQFTTTRAPDGSLKATYRDRNLNVSAADGANETAITTHGGVAATVKYGTASWGYGEEFDQATAMWWSPDSSRLAYYPFDRQHGPDFLLALN